MGGAKNRNNGLDAALPTEKEMAAVEALSTRFASALLEEGRKLGGRDPDAMARMLVFVTAGRVLARLGMVAAAAGAGMEQAVILAQRQEIIEAGRRMALSERSNP